MPVTVIFVIYIYIFFIYLFSYILFYITVVMIQMKILSELVSDAIMMQLRVSIILEGFAILH